jgi:hypothetical protein
LLLPGSQSVSVGARPLSVSVLPDGVWPVSSLDPGGPMSIGTTRVSIIRAPTAPQHRRLLAPPHNASLSQIQRIPKSISGLACLLFNSPTRNSTRSALSGKGTAAVAAALELPAPMFLGQFRPLQRRVVVGRGRGEGGGGRGGGGGGGGGACALLRGLAPGIPGPLRGFNGAGSASGI